MLRESADRQTDLAYLCIKSRAGSETSTSIKAKDQSQQPHVQEGSCFKLHRFIKFHKITDFI